MRFDNKSSNVSGGVKYAEKEAYHGIDSLLGQPEIFIPETYVPDLIITGGQCGADIGGLLGARAAGIATGGVAPKGYRTEAGPRPDLAGFGLIESASADYNMRTRENVDLCDALLLISFDFRSPGSKLTWDIAVRKPRCAVVYPKPPNPQDENAIFETRFWLYQVRPSVLMIAGNRESKAKGIERWTEKFVVDLFGAAGVK